MFGHKRIPSREGGVEIVVGQLSSRMAALGHTVVCYNRWGHHVGGADFDGRACRQWQGVQLRRVPTIPRRGLAAVSASFFAAVAAAFSRARVVHIHAEGPAAFCWLPRLLGKRVVVTVHGLDWQREKWAHGPGRAYIRLGEWAAARFAHAIIVLSPGVQQYFQDTYHRSTALIPNGVEAAQPLPAEEIRRQWGLEKDSYLLFMGRLVPEKGIHHLIRDFRQVDTEKRLVIAGSGSDTDDYVRQLRQLAAGDDRVVFTGFLQGRLWRELMTNAYVYVLPSQLEGMPLSLLEAMAYGNCCLVSDIPECAQVVGGSGVTFPAGDEAALARKMEELCAQEALVHHYKTLAAADAAAKYSWDQVVRRTLRLYDPGQEATP